MFADSDICPICNNNLISSVGSTQVYKCCKLEQHYTLYRYNPFSVQETFNIGKYMIVNTRHRGKITSAIYYSDPTCSKKLFEINNYIEPTSKEDKIDNYILLL